MVLTYLLNIMKMKVKSKNKNVQTVWANIEIRTANNWLLLLKSSIFFLNFCFDGNKKYILHYS